jgi:hypothetical protein
MDETTKEKEKANEKETNMTLLQTSILFQKGLCDDFKNLSSRHVDNFVFKIENQFKVVLKLNGSNILVFSN